MLPNWLERFIFSKTAYEIGCCYKRANSILHHMYSHYSGVRQPRFSPRSTKLSRRRPGKASKTRYEDYLP